MFAGGSTGATGQGIAFLVGADTVLQAVAAYCSSPQTTEINADKRAPTLMKWVHMGLGQSAVLIAGAMLIDPHLAYGFLLGGGITAAMMYASYLYAKHEGLKNGGESTESSTGSLWSRGSSAAA